MPTCDWTARKPPPNHNHRRSRPPIVFDKYNGLVLIADGGGNADSVVSVELFPAAATDKLDADLVNWFTIWKACDFRVPAIKETSEARC